MRERGRWLILDYLGDDDSRRNQVRAGTEMSLICLVNNPKDDIRSTFPWGDYSCFRHFLLINGIADNTLQSQTMAELQPYRGGYYLWKYLPSIPAAVIFLLLFLASTILISLKIYKARAWFCIVFAIGGLREFHPWTVDPESLSRFTIHTIATQPSIFC